MPYIKLNVTQKLDAGKKEQVKAKMGELIALIPGKSEAVTMVGIEDGCSLYMGGRALGNGAFIDVRLFGKAEKKDKEALTEAIFASMGDMLGTSDGDVYLNIFEMDSWGYGGGLK